MPLDRPKKQQVVPRSRVAEVIERAQEDARRTLRQAGVPEQQALAVMERIVSFSLSVFTVLDEAYRAFEEQIEEEGRSEAHQDNAAEKGAALLLQLESAIAAIAAEAIGKAIHDWKNQPRPPEPVIEVTRVTPSPPARLPGLPAVLRLLVWVAGMAASLLFSYQSSGSIVWAGIGLLIPFLLWVRLHSAWWALIFPVIALAGEAWVLYWLSVVEG
jgi:hypothetical protein